MKKGAAGYYTGDVIQLKQVLLSILDNAVKYTDAPGKVTLTAEAVSGGEVSREIKFTVTDTGVGIDPEYLPHIFEIFTQEDGSSTDRFGGSGLSLAVTKNIVDLMGGTIGIDSRKDLGSTFTVSIPMRLARLEAPSDESETAVSLEGKRILIVEDLPENAEIVQDLLELEGAETEHAENGKEGVDMFSASRLYYYDAILMDLRMPVMDGLEAARRIRDLGRDDAKLVPIIALTANAFDSDVHASREAGMNAHLAKPTDSDMLYDTLRRFIAAAEKAGYKGNE
jgi:CheY-like chemotaxis protein